MKLIIAGSREGFDWDDVHAGYVLPGFNATEIVSGCANGVDLLGEQLAYNLELPVKRFPAQWRVNGVYDNAAGYKRNVLMAEYADALLALRYNNSKGTTHMVEIAKKKGMPVY